MAILTREEFKKKMDALSKGKTDKPNNWISPVDVFAIEAGNSQGSANSGESSMPGAVSESRKELLNLDDAVSWIKENCNVDEILNGTELWRGRVSDEEILLIDPKQGDKRKSTDIVNIINMIMSEDPAWEDYPKRDKSLIMINNREETSIYGSSYRVFPHKDAKFGICSDNDLYDSFKKYDIGPSLISSFLIWLTRLFDINNANLLYSTNYNDVRLKLKDIEIELQRLDLTDEKDPLVKQIKIRLNNDRYIYKIVDSIIYNINKGSTFEKEISKLMDPKKNGFNLVDFKGLPENENIRRYAREIWTDSTCLLVRYNFLDSVIEKLKK